MRQASANDLNGPASSPGAGPQLVQVALQFGCRVLVWRNSVARIRRWRLHQRIGYPPDVRPATDLLDVAAGGGSLRRPVLPSRFALDEPELVAFEVAAQFLRLPALGQQRAVLTRWCRGSRTPLSNLHPVLCLLPRSRHSILNPSGSPPARGCRMWDCRQMGSGYVVPAFAPSKGKGGRESYRGNPKVRKPETRISFARFLSLAFSRLRISFPIQRCRKLMLRR